MGIGTAREGDEKRGRSEERGSVTMAKNDPDLSDYLAPPTNGLGDRDRDGGGGEGR